MAEATNMQPVKVIAHIFQVSTRRVEQLRAEGIIKGEGRPIKFDLLPTIMAYIKYLSDKAYGREKKQTDAQLATAKLEAEKRIKTAKAEYAELELKELKGELHRAQDVEEITSAHVMEVKAQLSAMPGRLAVDLSGTHTASEQANRVQKEVNEILTALANFKYDKEEYRKRVLERQGWDNKDERDEDVDEDE